MNGRWLLILSWSIFVWCCPSTSTRAIVAGPALQASTNDSDTNDASISMPAEPPTQRLGSDNTMLRERLLLTGTVLGVLLGQLAVLCGYLNANHATRGFYSGRLQSIAAVASIAVFLLGYAFYSTLT